MVNRLRWKLTAFNTVITGAILLGMTLLCLLISERNTRAQTFQNFSGNLSTVSSYLEVQNQLSGTWLRLMESSGRFSLSIQDGGTPLFSMGLSAERNNLAPVFQQARDRAVSEFDLSAVSARSGGSCAFSLRGEDGTGYFAGVSLIPKNGSVLELILLYPLNEMENGIHRQRMVVCIAALVAVALLGAFSWCFTGKMLRPIQENQQRQAQFIAAASHELRTPLTAILSAASAWERAECAAPARQTVFSDMIHREGKRMSRLIGDMLTLASADSQSWEVRCEDVELDMLLLMVYETYSPLAKEKGLALSLTLPERDVPVMQLDKDRITQVLSILLDNALAYTPAPGDIRLELGLGRNSARITVSDTGPGVPDSEKTRIFARFHRGETARSHRSHFGLGLCIAAEIVKLQKGKLWVEDAKGGGAAFILELPIS